jgi:hypothetical protein
MKNDVFGVVYRHSRMNSLSSFTLLAVNQTIIFLKNVF